MAHQCKCSQLEACPDCIHSKVKHLEAGDTLIVKSGLYDKPISLDGMRANRANPIILRGEKSLAKQELANLRPVFDKLFPLSRAQNAKQRHQLYRPRTKLPLPVITSGQPLHDYRLIANGLARQKQASGGFPGLYYVADEAGLHLRDCQNVKIEDLFFANSWPTAIYLDNCQNIDISHCRIFAGTFAVGATGENTRHILIDDCQWQQNVYNNGNWGDITWIQIHAHTDDLKGMPVDLKNDWRCYDGDFFSGWRIAGFLTIRGCVVSDAFNAIHLFNYSSGTPSRKLCRNVLIEDNTFERIRDNVVEPEYGAWNWVVRANRFIDVYQEFSWELQISGHFYVYGNVFWHTQVHGAGNDKRNIAAAIFKLSKKPHSATGPHNIFHNSFYMRGRIAKKYRLANFHFFNNAAIYTRKKAITDVYFVRSLFGIAGYHLATPHYPDSDIKQQRNFEKKRFTKAWQELDISFHYNIIAHKQSFQELMYLGYKFGDFSSNDNPGFAANLDKVKINEKHFKPKSTNARSKSASPMVKASCEFELETGGWQKIKEIGGRNIGAWQADGKKFTLSQEFEWIALLPNGDDPAYPG